MVEQMMALNNIDLSVGRGGPVSVPFHYGSHAGGKPPGEEKPVSATHEHRRAIVDGPAVSDKPPPPVDDQVAKRQRQLNQVTRRIVHSRRAMTRSLRKVFEELQGDCESTEKICIPSSASHVRTLDQYRWHKELQTHVRDIILRGRPVEIQLNTLPAGEIVVSTIKEAEVLLEQFRAPLMAVLDYVQDYQLSLVESVLLRSWERVREDFARFIEEIQQPAVSAENAFSTRWTQAYMVASPDIAVLSKPPPGLHAKPHSVDTMIGEYQRLVWFTHILTLITKPFWTHVVTTNCMLEKISWETTAQTHVAYHDQEHTVPDI